MVISKFKKAAVALAFLSTFGAANALTTTFGTLESTVSNGDRGFVGSFNNTYSFTAGSSADGRVFKNETMQAALARVAPAELGLQIATLAHPPVHLGMFLHFYGDCFAGNVGVSTHYVVLGKLVHLPSDTELVAADNQHSDLRWWPLQEALASESVHRYTKDDVQVLLRLQSQGGLHA